MAFLGLTSIFGTQYGLAQALGEEIFSLETEIEKSTFEARLVARIAAEFRLESALRVEGQDLSFRLPYCRAKGKNFDFIIGRATLGQGRALRKSPTSQIPQNPGSAWSGEVESTRAGFLMGLRWGGFSCFTLSESDSTVDLGKIGPEFNIPELRFKAAAAEAAVIKDDFCWAVGACAANSPERRSPEGWRSGASFEPELQALSIAGSAALNTKGIGLELWSGACLGSLIRPGLAGTAELRLGASRAGGMKPILSFYLKAYACSESYRNYLLEKPTLDSALKGDLSLSFRRFNLWASLLSSSPLKEKDSSGLRLLKEKGFSTLLWRWRTQALTGRAGLSWGAWGISARAKADQGGLASCDIGLDYESKEARGRLRFKAAARLYCIRGSSTISEDEDSELFDDETDEDWAETDSAGFTGFSDSFGNLVFHRLKLDAGLAWGASPAGGRAALALAVSAAEEGLEFRIYSEIAQRLGIGPRCSLQLLLTTPSGGYALDQLPDTIPTLSLGFTLSERNEK